MSLTISPTSGAVGSSISVYGSGFAANTYGSVFFDTNRNGVVDAGEPIQYLMASASGIFSTSLLVPSTSTGTYQVLAAFGSSAPQASASFTITSTVTSATGVSLTISPTSGAAGSSMIVTGSGFAANTYGSVFFDINRNNLADSGEPVQYLTTSATGTFSATLLVPSISAGSYPVLAAFGSSTPQALATFTITAGGTTGASITLTPNNGPGAISVAVTGSGFIANISGNVFFDINGNGTIDAGEPVQSLVTSASGSFSASLIVPSAAPGSYLVVAAFGGVTAQVSATFTLTAAGGTAGAVITLTPNFGPAGTLVTVTGSGFAANTSGVVFFDLNSNGIYNGGEPTVSIVTSTSGTFSTTLIVPDVTANAYQILATIPAGRPAVASATFVVR